MELSRRAKSWLFTMQICPDLPTVLRRKWLEWAHWCPGALFGGMVFCLLMNCFITISTPFSLQVFAVPGSLILTWKTLVKSGCFLDLNFSHILVILGVCLGLVVTWGWAYALQKEISANVFKKFHLPHNHVVPGVERLRKEGDYTFKGHSGLHNKTLTQNPNI